MTARRHQLANPPPPPKKKIRHGFDRRTGYFTTCQRHPMHVGPLLHYRCADLCKIKRQHLLTCKVSRYCPLILQIRILREHNSEEDLTILLIIWAFTPSTLIVPGDFNLVNVSSRHLTFCFVTCRISIQYVFSIRHRLFTLVSPKRPTRFSAWMKGRRRFK